MTNTKVLNPMLIQNLAERYIHMPENPDWTGLQDALKATGADGTEVFEAMNAIREGDY
jgi:hypothetical protein